MGDDIGHHDRSIFRVSRKVYQLLTRSERWGSLAMFGATLVSSILDVLGLATVIPVVNVAINPDAVEEVEFLGSLKDIVSKWGWTSSAEFITVLCVILMMAFLLKAVVNVLIVWYQTQFSYRIALRVSGLMWDYHFSKNLERMRSSESGQVLAEINGWPMGLGGSFLSNLLKVLQESIVIAILFAGLLVYSPIVIGVISVLMVLGSLSIRTLSKNRMLKYGEITKVLGPENATLITNAVRGALELWSFRAVFAVRKRFQKNQRMLFRLGVNTAILSTVPSKLYELLAVGAIAGAIILTANFSMGHNNLELLSFMALAAYRIMPSLARLQNSIMSIRRGMFVVHVIHDALEGRNDVQLKELNPIAAQTSNVVSVTCSNLALGYEALPEPVLKDLNVSFNSGGIHAIVGPSGSGKSTLINGVLGIQPVLSGVISITGLSNQPRVLHEELDPFDWMCSVGYLSQMPFLFRGSVRENLTMMRPKQAVDEDLVLELVSRLDMGEALGPNPFDFVLNEGGTNLSGGQQQRLALIRALQFRRPVFILDEATSALDEVMRDVVFDILRERADEGACIILVTHDKAVASQCDSVLDLESFHRE